MGYRTLRACVDDLARNEMLIRIEESIDARLEAAEVQRRVYAAGGPAVYFANVTGCHFPMVSNLFGSLKQTEFIFRDALQGVQRLVEAKIDPSAVMKKPWRAVSMLKPALSMLPRRRKSGPILKQTCQLSHLPQLVSWPDDGGPFVTLPAVYTEHPDQPGLMNSNLGMYRVQMAGNEFVPDQEVGLHYQIHRSIGVHHAAAIRKGEPLPVNIVVGGPPAMPVAAVMPLPEGLSELMFAGALSGRAIRMVGPKGTLPMPAEADFVIAGEIDPKATKPEGPFGDHLGYYSLVHPFPFVRVRQVYHRAGAIWPFTAVGRPPQEDTSFGEFIHELTGPAIPSVLPGVKGVHAVDAAGVHPLLLAIGSERYVPYASERTPQEILTQANAILGQGQLSLAKFLLIIANEDNPDLDIEDIDAFLEHLLSRVDWRRDLHIQTQTTIDTLDYSGSGFNRGSKIVIAAAGEPRRTLPDRLPEGVSLPDGFRSPSVVRPGILAVEAPQFRPDSTGNREREPEAVRFCEHFDSDAPLNEFPLIVLVDDAEFTARTLNNFLWVTFTRANPAADVYGIGERMWQKHWGCEGSLIIDARIKPQHAPPLIEDPEVTRRVDRLFASGGPLSAIDG